MPEQKKSKNVDQLMAEADELMHQIHNDFIDDMEDRHRLEFEQHSQKLEKLKSKVKAKETAGEEESAKITSSAEGMHEAFEDIVKAMKQLKEKVF